MTASKPTAGFWITVALVAVLVGYPLSYGPARAAIAPRELLPGPDPVVDAYRAFYQPIFWTMECPFRRNFRRS